MNLLFITMMTPHCLQLRMSLRRLSAFLDAEELNEQTLDDKGQKVINILRLFLFIFLHRHVKEWVTIIKLSVSPTPPLDGTHAGVFVANNV